MTSSEQARADAMADAETLRHEAEQRGIDAMIWMSRATAPLHGVHFDWYAPDYAYRFTRLAARAAFRAVPGLRGDK